MKKVDNEGLEINYNARFKEYSVRMNGIEDYRTHKQLIDSLIKGSKEYFNIMDD